METRSPTFWLITRFPHPRDLPQDKEHLDGAPSVHGANLDGGPLLHVAHAGVAHAQKDHAPESCSVKTTIASFVEVIGKWNKFIWDTPFEMRMERLPTQLITQLINQLIT